MPLPVEWKLVYVYLYDIKMFWRLRGDNKEQMWLVVTLLGDAEPHASWEVLRFEMQ